jgi:hypothetical protein
VTQSLNPSLQSLNSLVIHGHYYQPPRENPWLEEVEVEPNAAPFHDWNERIERESYRAVVAARMLGREGRIARIINTLSWTSFNFGPTLLNWMDSAAPDTYAAILDADRESVRRLGHGNAIAQTYHHSILPLSTRRDKTTEVRWGIADFRRRFGREPEGMWLPETAVDDETLDVLAAEGIRFTILAPHQASPLPPNGLPGLYHTSNGRTISLCFYDGDMAHGVAFGELIRNAGLWSARIRGKAAAQPGGIIAIAIDGETFGHHHKFGEMALARVIGDFRSGTEIKVENFASFLARNPAVHEVRLNAPSSWSCAHGVERWKSECGCKTAPHLPTQQQWRAVLRDSLDWLASEIHAIYQREATPLFHDVWDARDRYDPATGPSGGLDHRRRELLELERHALMIYTSCAWFFDDLAGIEPVQVLKYAARAIELTGREAPRIETEFLRRLAAAKSNDPVAGNGRDLYLHRVKPKIPDQVRLAAGLAALDALDLDPDQGAARAFESSVSSLGDGAWEVRLQHERTGREHRFRVGQIHPEIEVVLAESSLDAPLGWRLTEEGLWDRHRGLLTEARRVRLVSQVLSAEDREALASGKTDLSSAARTALTRAVEAAARGAEEDIERAFLAIDLLSMLELAIPFDAQTGFALKTKDATPDVLNRLRPLAWRLGFSIEDR